MKRAIVALNFRREPIFPPDDIIETDPRYRRYAIAALPFLRALRQCFVGRAIHTSFEAWQKQLLELEETVR